MPPIYHQLSNRLDYPWNANSIFLKRFESFAGRVLETWYVPIHLHQSLHHQSLNRGNHRSWKRYPRQKEERKAIIAIYSSAILSLSTPTGFSKSHHIYKGSTFLSLFVSLIFFPPPSPSHTFLSHACASTLNQRFNKAKKFTIVTVHTPNIQQDYKANIHCYLVS